MTAHERAAMYAILTEIERLNIVRHLDIVYEVWQAARAYEPPVVCASKRPSWADVRPGDRVTIEGGDEPMTAWETPSSHSVENLNRDCPIIRIERPEYRDITPREQEPAKRRCGECAHLDPIGGHGRGCSKFV
jgi:hypothetical protein